MFTRLSIYRNIFFVAKNYCSVFVFILGFDIVFKAFTDRINFDIFL